MSTGTSGAGGSLPPCAICHVKVALYRCPRCLVCTCSLACSRAHKVSASDGLVCDGQRDRTPFRLLKDFTDAQLASDYHFLEDVLKVSDGSKRLFHGMVTGDACAPTAGAAATAKRARVNTNTNNFPSGRLGLESISTTPPAHPLLRAREGTSAVEVLARGVNDDVKSDTAPLSYPNQRGGIVSGLLAIKPTGKAVPPKREKPDHLVRQAELKGINLLRMPLGMERRRSNTTRVNKKQGIIWKIELRFHQPTSCPASEKTVPQLLTVENVFEASSWFAELGKHLDVHPGNGATRSSLRAFAAAPREAVALFLKRVPCAAGAPRYVALDPHATVRDSLRGKTLIEFPTVEVVLAEDKGRFPLFIGEV